MAWVSKGGTEPSGRVVEGACMCQKKQGWEVRVSAMSEHPYSRLPTGRKKTTYVHEESHDSGTEEASHRHSHEPGNKYVPEEAPVHSLPRADPAHGYHGAHLEEQRHLSRNEVF